jgi:hypothetical protein
MCKTGFGDSHPPEPQEVPEEIVEITYDNIRDKECFTAEQLNKRLEWDIEYMFHAELDEPIYLNGQEWNGETKR